MTTPDKKCEHNYIIDYRSGGVEGLQCDKCYDVQPTPDKTMECTHEHFSPICNTCGVDMLSLQRDMFLNQPANQHDQEVRNAFRNRIIEECEKEKWSCSSKELDCPTCKLTQAHNSALQQIIDIVKSI